MIYRIKRFSKQSDLKSYLDKIIKQYYSGFDKAHNIPHVTDVVNRGHQYQLEYEKQSGQKLDSDIVLASCVFHDIGLLKGREDHEKSSGKLIRDKFYKDLLSWFTPEQIETIAQAAEDHRSSMKSDPRSIYGRIVSEADRNNPKTIQEFLNRAILYRMGKGLSDEEIAIGATDHLIEKFGPKGYNRRRLDIPSTIQRDKRIADYTRDRDKLYREALKLVKKLK